MHNRNGDFFSVELTGTGHGTVNP